MNKSAKFNQENGSSRNDYLNQISKTLEIKK